MFGWNDPAGEVIANRGFSLSDRQTTLFGRVGATHSGPLRPVAVFDEIDHRAGFYTGVEARYFDRVVVRALHYDNRGDPAAFDAFAVAVLGSEPAPADQAALRAALDRWYRRYHTIIAGSLPASPWGPARLDAVAMIFNRLTGEGLTCRVLTF